jgi:hypothetical protein
MMSDLTANPHFILSLKGKQTARPVILEKAHEN